MPKQTRIGAVDAHLVGRHCFVTVTSEDGEQGTGQSGYFSFPHVTLPILDALRAGLVGQNPDDIGRLWLEMYRTAPLRGGALTSTIAAVDLALWDLKGRRFGVPAYELLGGRQRTKVRAHYLLGMRAWPNPATGEELLSEARSAVEQGFTAVKLDPLLDGFQDQSYAGMIADAATLVGELRQTVGPQIDIALEIHRKLAVAEAIALADAVRPFGIFMFEDALPPDSVSEWRRLAEQIRIPLGVGERQDSIYEFADLLDAGVGDFWRPDVGTAGGLSACVKIAALAESRHRRIIAHNFVSPFLTAATLQLYASVPNVGTLEWNPLDEDAPAREMLSEPIPREGGWLLIPDGPGLGVSLATDYLAAGPVFTPPSPMGTSRTVDGSIHAR
jgi:galactonate dehydratase